MKFRACAGDSLTLLMAISGLALMGTACAVRLPRHVRRRGAASADHQSHQRTEYDPARSRRAASQKQRQCAPSRCRDHWLDRQNGLA